jgi:hypothetical protein
MEQHVRFCVAPDGVRWAYARHGNGPPIVRAATWLTHLDFDRESLVWRHRLADHVLDVCRVAHPSWYDGVAHLPFAEDPARFDRELRALAASPATAAAQIGCD